MNTDQNWNRMEWQGRSRKQVESNQTVAMLAVGGIALVFVFQLIVEIYKTLAAAF